MCGPPPPTPVSPRARLGRVCPWSRLGRASKHRPGRVFAVVSHPRTQRGDPGQRRRGRALEGRPRLPLPRTHARARTGARAHARVSCPGRTCCAGALLAQTSGGPPASAPRQPTILPRVASPLRYDRAAGLQPQPSPARHPRVLLRPPAPTLRRRTPQCPRRWADLSPRRLSKCQVSVSLFLLVLFLRRPDCSQRDTGEPGVLCLVGRGGFTPGLLPFCSLSTGDQGAGHAALRRQPPWSVRKGLLLPQT